MNYAKALDLDYEKALENHPKILNYITPEYDKYTGVLQKDSFFDYTQKLIDEDSPFALCIIDIDHFKSINESVGHVAADTIIISVIEQILRQFQTPIVIGRFCADEFLMLFEDCVEYEKLWDLSFQINHCFTSPMQNVPLSVTMGISRFPNDASNKEDLFETADKALFRGKTKGRDCFIIYLEEKHKHMNLKSSKELKTSLQNLFSQSFILLNRGTDYKRNVTEVMEYLTKQFMFDNICIQSDTQIIMEKKSKYSATDKILYIDKKLLTKYMNNGGILSITSVDKLKNEDEDLYKTDTDQKISSQLAVNIMYDEEYYGAIRMEMSSMDRIWQSDEITLAFAIAQSIAQHLHYTHKTLNDEDWG